MIDILVTCDQHYLEPLYVMLYSLRQNNMREKFKIWLIHNNIPVNHIENFKSICHLLNFEASPILFEEDIFDDAKTQSRYPKEMYFRILSGQILPGEVKKVLYLDPDILIINPIRALWETDLSSHLMAACTHTGLIDFSTPINKVRLNTDHGYFNSGMLLINLELARQLIHVQDIKEALDRYNQLLILPDQDILNRLYGKYFFELDEEYYNYDTRRFLTYLTRSKGEYDLQWVIKNTVVLHFCGRPKPWDEASDTRFTALYLNYQQQLLLHRQSN